MKKLLVAAVAAALTLGSVSAPANAVGEVRPVLTAPSTVAVGDTVSATTGSNPGWTSTGLFWVSCAASHTVADMEANAFSTYMGNSCDLVNGGSGALRTTTYTLARTWNGNWSGRNFLTSGRYLFAAEEFVDPNNNNTYVVLFAPAVYVVPPTVTMPSIKNAANATDIAVGDVLSVSSGSNFPEVASSSYDNGVIFCNYEVNPTIATDPNALWTGIYSAPYCEFLGNTNNSSPGAPTFPYTLGATVNGWGVPNTPFSSTGLYFYNYVTYRDTVNSSVYRHYWSASAFVGVRAQTVTYDANTGSGVIAASVANGARALSNGAALSKPGFTFAGWNTAANGSGTSIAAGASYTPSGNVTVYAQWNRIPTPPAPVFTSPIAVAPVGGVLNLTGSNMAAVTSITVDDMPATISTSSNGAVSVKLPTLAPGKYDITIKNADGGIRFIDGLIVPDPNAKPAVKPTITYVASSAAKVTGSAPTAKQTAAVKAFVAQYKNAKTVTVYVRTSKAGLASAKKAAAAMLATAVKALGGKLKGSVVIDSTSERSTALDVVVTD